MTTSFFAKATRIATATAFVALVAAGSASATTMNLTYDGSVVGFKSLTVTEPGTASTKTYLTGAYKMKDTTSMNSFVVFCLDLLASVQGGKNYNYTATNTPFSNSENLSVVGAGGLSGIDRIQRIFDYGYDTALETTKKSAGFQLALWNAVYDDDWSVGDDAAGTNGGTFYMSDTGNNSFRAAANQLLSGAEGYAGTKKWNLTFLESTETNPRSQNLVTATPVPLPAAGLMLLTALGGLWMGRRRKAA